MNEQTGNPQGMNRPRLKKIKRPIRKIMPQAPMQPQQRQESTYRQEERKPVQQIVTSFNNPADDFEYKNNPFSPEEEIRLDNEDPFNADAYLDQDENLPTVNQNYDKRNYEPQFIENEADIYDPQPQGGIGVYYNGEPLSRNVLFIIGTVLFFLGFLFAKIFFSEEKIVREGLQGVVVNSDIPKGRARCGTTEKNQGCVLYIMNPQRQELYGRDFYDLASQLTGRQRFMIETGNMRYANERIRPGEIGQFNIPSL